MFIRQLCTCLALIPGLICYSQEWKPSLWPLLRTYQGHALKEVALPLGGIGTGTVSLGGRGELKDWEIMNIPGKGYSTVPVGNDAPFFAIFMKEKGKKAIAAALLGPVLPSEYMHMEGRSTNHYGLPRFSNAKFSAAYPFGEVSLWDEHIPVSVKIKGFNPLLPANEEASGLPVAVLSYEVSNPANNAIEVAVCGSMRNFVGKDGSKYTSDFRNDYIPTGAKRNVNVYHADGTLKGLYMYSDGVAKNDPAWGTIALSTAANGGVTYRTSSRSNMWGLALLDFWDDFSDDGQLVDAHQSVDDDPMGSLAVKKTVPAKGRETFTFFITWNFPNRMAWSPTVVGNYYSIQYDDAWDAAKKIVPQIPELESKTIKFVGAFIGSTYPQAVKEAALFNLANLRSQTTFRIPSGHLMGWEGIMNRTGSCWGSCTHVWNYELATPFLFGHLARTMRDVEFNYATRDDGMMYFRAKLPLSEAAKGKGKGAADGQMGCIVKFYRDWQLSGDDAFLKTNWKQIKKVLSYAWTEGGWDGNQDGVMEGAQHNTFDEDYYGPNPQTGFWYLAALKAGSRMALYMNDKEFADTCDDLFRRGSSWMDAHLFNGEYYEQKITDPQSFQFLDMNDPKVKIPDYQLGTCCIVDQLVGQVMAHICGLGHLAKKEHIQTALRSIIKYNYQTDFTHQFNQMRSFVMGKESGLLIGSWPHGGRLKVPFAYFNEVMTGFEYAAATEMIYEDLQKDGLRIIKSIRDRFDGEKRNPFNEVECGGHYARAMASWAAVIALSDFQYSGVSKSMSITSNPGRYFWSNGYAWGICQVTSNEVKIELLSGTLELKELAQKGKKAKRLDHFKMSEGDIKTIAFK